MTTKDRLSRSPLFYVGDKYKLLNEILNYFPKTIKTFIEPFVGGGSVFLNTVAENYLLNDIDSNLIDIHRLLISYNSRPELFFLEVQEIINKYNLSRSYISDIIPQDLKKEWKKTYIAKFNKKGYLNLRRDFNDLDESNPLLLYILVIYGFNRMLRYNSKGEFNIPVGNVDFNVNTKKALEDYFNFTKSKKIRLFNLDFKNFLNTIEIKKDDFIYFDPPYLITNSEYNKIWTDRHEKELLLEIDKLNQKGIKFAFSNVTHYKGKENSQFIKWSQKYNFFKIKSNYISYHDNSIKNFKEGLVTNFR